MNAKVRVFAVLIIAYYSSLGCFAQSSSTHETSKPDNNWQLEQVKPKVADEKQAEFERGCLIWLMRQIKQDRINAEDLLRTASESNKRNEYEGYTTLVTLGTCFLRGVEVSDAPDPEILRLNSGLFPTEQELRKIFPNCSILHPEPWTCAKQIEECKVKTQEVVDFVNKGCKRINGRVYCRQNGREDAFIVAQYYLATETWIIANLDGHGKMKQLTTQANTGPNGGSTQPGRQASPSVQPQQQQDQGWTKSDVAEAAAVIGAVAVAADQVWRLLVDVFSNQ